jgi:hypothetical protein
MSRTFAGLAALAIVAAPAAAVGYGFDASYSGAVPVIGAINVVVNPELVRETNTTTQRQGVIYIAPSDAEDLVESLREELEDELGKANAFSAMSGGAVATLNVTIEEASPSNPAHTENGRNAGLDFRSFGRGGATLSAQLVDAGGTPVADFTYRWEESSFDVESVPRIGWYGAERAFDRFAARLARELPERQAGGAS